MPALKISDEGRGTILIYEYVKSSPGCYVVGNVHNNAGYYQIKPMVYQVHVNAHGEEYILNGGKRVYGIGGRI